MARLKLWPSSERLVPGLLLSCVASCTVQVIWRKNTFLGWILSAFYAFFLPAIPAGVLSRDVDSNFLLCKRFGL